MIARTSLPWSTTVGSSKSYGRGEVRSSLRNLRFCPVPRCDGSTLERRHTNRVIMISHRSMARIIEPYTRRCHGCDEPEPVSSTVTIRSKTESERAILNKPTVVLLAEFKGDIPGPTKPVTLPARRFIKKTAPCATASRASRNRDRQRDVPQAPGVAGGQRRNRR